MPEPDRLRPLHSGYWSRTLVTMYPYLLVENTGENFQRYKIFCSQDDHILREG
jgi:hypothetical protein